MLIQCENLTVGLGVFLQIQVIVYITVVNRTTVIPNVPRNLLKTPTRTVKGLWMTLNS